MNLNRFIIPSICGGNGDICRRAKVDTGYTCNYGCNFCYYKNNLKDPYKDISSIYDNILDLSDAGITSFDFSGGESSIHPEFINMIRYAKNFGNVSTLSNGSTFYKKEYLKECFDAGLTEVLFSLHGWDDNSHNSMVKHSNAFSKIIQSIKNCKDLGIIVRINCTIQDNFDEKKYYNLISDILPDQLNMLPLNYWEDAADKISINYKKISLKIHNIIDKLKNRVIINVRYIPFCFMVGYEKYCVGIYQHIYDKYDWNIFTYSEKGTFDEKSMFDAAHRARLDFIKPLLCNDCSYKIICDGIEDKNISNNSLIPQPGYLITDVNHFRKD